MTSFLCRFTESCTCSGLAQR